MVEIWTGIEPTSSWPRAKGYENPAKDQPVALTQQPPSPGHASTGTEVLLCHPRHVLTIHGSQIPPCGGAVLGI